MHPLWCFCYLARSANLPEGLCIFMHALGILQLLWQLQKGVLVITLPNLNQFRWNWKTPNISDEQQWKITKIGMQLPEVPPNSAKHTLCLSLKQHGLLDTYPARISTIFEMSAMNRCTGAYSFGKISDFMQLEFSVPQNAKICGNFEGVIVWSIYRACSSRQFCAIRIISGAIQNPKNTFCWMWVLGAIQFWHCNCQKTV